MAAQAARAAAEEATASSPNHSRPDGRPDHGAAAARTEELYRDHGRLVSGLCRALLRDRAEGEDAAQQVFLAAHRALLNGTSPREPAAWLATIARNECWARIRARMREPLPTAEVEAERSLSDPLAEAIRNADLAAMWRAIAQLPRQQRDALLLREFGGLSYDELSGALAVSGSAVESLLFRARQGVRARVETAYAGLTGGLWLESLTRLVGGLGGGVAPVAAKVAAVGVGAAVATGGAVFAPRLLDHVPAHHAARQPVRANAHPDKAAPAPALPIFVARAQTPAASTAARSATAGRHEGGSSSDTGFSGTRSSGGDGNASGRGEDHGSSGSGDTSGDNGDGGNRVVRNAVETVSRHEDSSEGSSSGDGGGGSGGGGSGDDSSSGGGSSDGGSGSGDGGVQLTTPNPVGTVTAPPVVDPPVVGVPVPGDGG